MLTNFLEDGKLKIYPSKRANKLLALEYLVTKFEPNYKYTEKEVNEIINNYTCFKDCALLRRELYDFKFLDRNLDNSFYWIKENR